MTQKIEIRETTVNKLKPTCGFEIFYLPASNVRIDLFGSRVFEALV